MNRTEERAPVTPAPWTVHTTTAEQHLAAIRRDHPRAVVWLGEATGAWWALPAGADSECLVSAASLSALRYELGEYYARHPRSPRPAPARPTQRRAPAGATSQTPRPAPAQQPRPGEGGAVARSTPTTDPVASRPTAPTSPTDEAYVPRHSRRAEGWPVESSASPPAQPHRRNGMWRLGERLGLVQAAA
ncbi:hypothetical protein [Thermomonospora echinospora]|nr:hypothetical protein [Thermomonospora echinospora]